MPLIPGDRGRRVNLSSELAKATEWETISRTPKPKHQNQKILRKCKHVKVWRCTPAIPAPGVEAGGSHFPGHRGLPQQYPVSKTLRAGTCNSVGKHLPSMRGALDLSPSTENKKTCWWTVLGIYSICYQLDSLHNKFLQHRRGGSKPQMEMIPSDGERGWLGAKVEKLKLLALFLC